jgi:chorismate binding enzyme
MELIDQFEVTRRGPYSGGFGGVSFMGDMDIALALRTIVFPTGSTYNLMYSYGDNKQRREWVAHLQVPFFSPTLFLMVSMSGHVLIFDTHEFAGRSRDSCR